MHGGQAQPIQDGHHVGGMPGDRRGSFGTDAVTASAQVGRDQAEAGRGGPQPVPQPALAADAVDGDHRLRSGSELLDVNGAAGDLYPGYLA